MKLIPSRRLADLYREAFSYNQSMIIRHTSKTVPRIAVVTLGVKLGDETRGYTRFRFIADALVQAGFEVDLITTNFQHWEKAHRDTSNPSYQSQAYRVVFINEPGYKRNLDLRRLYSHRVAAKNLKTYFEENIGEYSLIYAEIPPNDVARVCAEAAHAAFIPFVVDVNDLWPEAMRMVLNIPLVSSLVFYPFKRDARIAYRLCAAAVGTSDEYAHRPLQDRERPCSTHTVYVGTDLKAFDAGVRSCADEIDKPENELWVTYAGTLGASYDLSTLIQASALLDTRLPQLRLMILGDGPDRRRLEREAADFRAPVRFCGYQDFPHMAAWLSKSDIVVNSLVRSAAQSIVTKIGDYLASGKPMINTGLNSEFCAKVEQDGFGVNVEPENPEALAQVIEHLAGSASKRKIMGMRARQIAENQFDQNTSYATIVKLVQSLT